MAIRILGSVVDVRPADFGAQQRLMRLERWQGREVESCRFALGLAAFRLTDTTCVADAWRCSDSLGIKSDALKILQQDLTSSLDETTLKAVEPLSRKAQKADVLSGDLQLSATWDMRSSADLDLSLIDPDGHRISWLGAPSRSVISALDVTSTSRESLALRGGKPGDYVIEVAPMGSADKRAMPTEGQIQVYVAGTRQMVKFRINDQLERVAVVRITTVAKLVPLSADPRW